MSLNPDSRNLPTAKVLFKFKTTSVANLEPYLNPKLP